METGSAEPGGENYSLPTQTASTPPIVTVNTNIPTSPPLTIEIEPADSAPPLPPKKVRVRGRAPSKKAKTLDLALTSTPHGSTSTSMVTLRRSGTPPKVPTPPFVTRRLSPFAPRASNPVPQSQSQKPKTPSAFPLLSVFTQSVGPQAVQSRPPPPLLANQPRPASPTATQSQIPVQLSTPRPALPDTEGKDKGGRKGFDPLLLQRVVEEKDNTKKADLNKPAINRLFAVPATSNVASPSTVLPTSTLLKASTPFGSASLGTRFGGFGLTKAASFGASGFGVSVDAVARPTQAPASGGFGGFGSRTAAGAGGGFTAFGTVASGSGPSAGNFGFTPAAFSNQASASPIQTSNVRGEGDDDDEQDHDSYTDMDDELGVDMSVDVEDDLAIRTRDTAGEPKVLPATQPQAQAQHQSQTQAQTQGSSQSVTQPSVTTSRPVPEYPQLNVTLTNELPTHLALSGPAHSAPTASLVPTQPIVTPLSQPASPFQGTMTNTLPPTSLFYLDSKPRRRDSPSASSSISSSAPGPTRLIEQTIRKYVTLDPVTLVPTIVDLDQMVGDLQTMRLVVHHNFLPRTAPTNGDYRRGLENLLKKRKRKRGEPRKVYRGAGDDDLGSVTESD